MKLIKKTLTVFVFLGVALNNTSNASDIQSLGTNLEEIQATILKDLTSPADKAIFEKFNKDLHEAVLHFVDHEIDLCSSPYQLLVTNLEEQAKKFDAVVQSITVPSATQKLKALQNEFHALCTLLRNYVGKTGHAYVELGRKLLHFRNLMPQCIRMIKKENLYRYLAIINCLKQLK